MHLAGNETAASSRSAPSSTSPLPSPAALQSLLRAACPGRSPAGGRGHTGTAEPRDSCPLKCRVSQGLPAWRGDHGHSTETPAASRAWSAHRRQRTETPSTAPAAPGRAAQGTGAELTFTPSFFLLPPLLPPGERRKEISRARQGTKTRRARISSMVPGARVAGPPSPAGGARLFSSNHRCDPRELRGDLASTVLSYPSGSWPGA